MPRREILEKLRRVERSGSEGERYLLTSSTEQP